MAVRILQGDAIERLRELPAESVQCCVTSPPYWGLRDYGVQGQYGLEETIDAHVAVMVDVFREVRRVLRKDATLWLNYGDCFLTGAGKVGLSPGGGRQGDRWQGPNSQPNRMPVSGIRPKNLAGMPWRVAFALQTDGWILRRDIIWHKPSAMPESAKDRPTTAHEYVFLLAREPRYFYNAEAAQEAATKHLMQDQKAAYEPKYRGVRGEREDFLANGSEYRPKRNYRSVWTIASHLMSEAHFATFPPRLVERCLTAGTREGDTVLDPFGGAGTTALVADRMGRDAILIELNPDYVEMARERIYDDCPLFAEIGVVEEKREETHGD